MKKFLFTLIISVAFFFNVNADEQNVTVTVEVTYKNGVKKTFVGKDLAKPQTTTQINVKIDPYLNNTSNPATSVECTQITGAKCI